MTQKQTQPIHTLTPTDLTQAREAIDAWYEADGNRAMPALVAAFDKPYGMTSFQLVARVRRLLTQYWQVKKVKIGHAGHTRPPGYRCTRDSAPERLRSALSSCRPASRNTMPR